MQGTTLTLTNLVGGGVLHPLFYFGKFFSKVLQELPSAFERYLKSMKIPLRKRRDIMGYFLGV
jgi:hypothetical protein